MELEPSAGHPAFPSGSDRNCWCCLNPRIIAYLLLGSGIIFPGNIIAGNHASVAALIDPLPAIRRVRRPVSSIFQELGESYTSRAYRMTALSFWTLHRLLYLHMGYDQYPSLHSKKMNRNGAKNGRIHSTHRLSIAIRYFAGGSPYDIALMHGVSHTEVFRSIWTVVDAVNKCPALDISFPNDYDAQRNLAKGFKAKSQAGFDCCIGA